MMRSMLGREVELAGSRSVSQQPWTKSVRRDVMFGNSLTSAHWCVSLRNSVSCESK